MTELVRCLKVGIHEKPDLLEAFHERRTREFGGEIGGPSFLQKTNLRLAELQLPAVLSGLLALLSPFLVNLLYHILNIPTSHPPSLFLCKFGRIV